jgi:hypothetical protein
MDTRTRQHMVCLQVGMEKEVESIYRTHWEKQKIQEVL